MKLRWSKLFLFTASLLALLALVYRHPEPASADVNHCGTLSSSETWLASDNVHVVTCDVIIPAGVTLTIEPGAIVKLQDDVDISVNGRLVAQGLQANPIRFTSYKDDLTGGDTNGDGSSSAPAIGDWGHIVFNSGSDDSSIISRVVIRYSGGASYPHIDDGAIYLHLNASPELSYITFTDNYINGVELASGNWTTDTWDNTTMVYVLEEGDITVQALNTLTITPSMKIKLNDDADIRVAGRLVAVGTKTNPIYFSSVYDDSLCGKGALDEDICDTHQDGLTAPAVGNWGHIVFNSGSDDSSIISRAVIRYSGGASYPHIDDGAIYFALNASPKLSYITFTNNYINGVELASGNWTTDTWDNTTMVYVLEEGDITVQALNTLTITPSMKIKLNDDADIRVAGRLVAVGTKTNPIYFSSVYDDSLCGKGASDEDICDTHQDGLTAPGIGNWGHIVFNSGSDDSSIISRAVIRYSGGASYPHIDDGAIYFALNASPKLSYITFTNNYINGVELASGNWTTDTWDNTTMVYVLEEGDITVQALNTLTITPSMKIKLNDDADIRVAGRLVAVGTKTNPIYFSSVYDDSLCGKGASDEDICDTHQDGLTAPGIGNWGHIVFNSGSDDSSIISRAVIRYSGGASYPHIDDGAIYFALNASPKLSYITFTNNYINGVELASGNWTTDTWDNTTMVYVLEEGDITVQALNTLTITPSMKIKLNDDADIRVAGRLVAVGTKTNPIYFSSVYDDSLCGKGASDEDICDTHQDGLTAPGIGNWGHIVFNSGSDDSSIISRAVIRYSGGASYPHIDDGAIYFALNASPKLSYITFTNNYINGVELASGNWTTDTWDNTTMVYVLEEGDITVQAADTLTINPGMKIKFGVPNRIWVDGKLLVPGTTINPVYFTSRYDDTLCGVGAFDEPICDTHNDGTTVTPKVGDWGSIIFRAGSDDTSLITRSVFRYGGNGINGAIFLFNASPGLSYITFTDNYINGVELDNALWTSDTWDNTTVVYVLEEGDITVPAADTLTINPGMKIKFGVNRIWVDGKLVVSGTSSNPVYFSSRFDDTLCGIGAFDEPICDTHNDGTTVTPKVGDWGSIIFRAGSDDTSLITRSVFRYGGNGNNGAIFLFNASPGLSYITFTDNYINGVELDNALWTSDTWDNTTVVYVLEEGDITVPAADTLTINPGMKIKFGTASDIWVDGKLVVPGTTSSPVYFTSRYDDALCGVGAFDESICDTHNDGTTATPKVGDWGHIVFNSVSDDNSLITRTLFRYSGGAAIRLVSASPTVSHSSLTQNYRGIEVLNSSAPTLTCNDIHNNTNLGIYNNTPATPVTAEGHWWGDPSGPAHATNPGGIGQSVSDGVDFTPWQTASCIFSSLHLTKQVNTGLAKPGDSLTYTLVLAETTGNGDVTTYLSDPIPANTSYVPGSATVQPAGSGILTDTGAKIEWFGTVTTNAAITLTFQAAVVNSLSSDIIVTNVAAYDNGLGAILTRTATTTIDTVPPSSTIAAPLAGQIFSSTNISIQGTAADATSGIDRVEVSVDGGLTWQTATGATSWTYDWTPLADGVYTLTTRAIDQAGQVETSGPGITVTVDATPPATLITLPSNGETITRTTYTISGTAADSLSGIERVEISTNNGSSWVQAGSSSPWSYLWGVPNEDGVTHVLKARSRDKAGNLASTSVVTVTVDNVKPTSIIANLVDGQVISSTSYLLQGAASDGAGIAQVEVSLDGGTTWQAASGATSWSYDWNLSSSGVYTVMTRATDSSGNVEATSSGLTVTADNAPPTTLITTPANGETITGTTTLISGLATDNFSGIEQVEVSIDNGSSWIQAGDTSPWSYLWFVPVEDGVTHALQARSRDKAGNLGSASVVTVTVDNVKPTSTIANLVDGQVISSTSYLLQGTASDGAGIAQIEISLDGGTTWQLASGTTNWTYNWVLSGGGVHSVMVRATDNSGLVETISGGLTVEVDTELPTSTIILPTDGEIITGTLYTISGAASDADSGVAEVYVSLDDGTSWSTAAGTDTWSYPWTVSAEDYVMRVLKARARDRAGNLENTSVVTVTVDNMPPVSQISNLVDGQVLSSTTYIIQGTASDGSGVTQVEISTDGGVTWQAVTGTTSWTYTWTLPAAIGSHTILVRATDRTGHVETAGGGITVDVQPVAAPSSDTYTFLPLIIK